MSARRFTPLAFAVSCGLDTNGERESSPTLPERDGDCYCDGQNRDSDQSDETRGCFCK